MPDLRRTALAAVLWSSLMGTLPSAAADAPLAPKYRTWLEEVALLMVPAERKAFLALTEDHRRDAFIAAFWKTRDPDPASPRNEFKDAYYARREEARTRFGGVADDAAKVWILNGEPNDVFKIDCSMALWPIEVWSYRSTARIARGVTVLFYRPGGGKAYRRWSPSEGFKALMAFSPDQPFPRDGRQGSGPGGNPRPDEAIDSVGDGTFGSDFSAFLRYVEYYCKNHREEYQHLLDAVRHVQGLDRSAAALLEAPLEPDPEWLASFAAGSTDVPAAREREAITAEELRWLDEVAVLIRPEERRAYLALPRAYQRAGFVDAFWKARDTNSKTPENEARAVFTARLETARQRWKSLTLDQARTYLVNGEPADVVKSDCSGNLWPLEIWRYAYSDRSRRPFQLLFYQPPPGVGPFRLWHATDGYAVLVRRPLPGANPNARPGTGDFNELYRLMHDGVGNEPPWCRAEAPRIIDAMKRLEYGDLMLAEVVLDAPPVDPEWLASYRAYSTDVESGSTPLDADLQVDYPGRHRAGHGSAWRCGCRTTPAASNQRERSLSPARCCETARSTSPSATTSSSAPRPPTAATPCWWSATCAPATSTSSSSSRR